MTEKIFKMIKDNEVKFVDFRFTDPRGKWQHTAQTVESVDEDLLTKGIMFDGSSPEIDSGIGANSFKIKN